MDAIIGPPETATEAIRFGFGQFSLGTVLVAVSANGVAAILMGDEREPLRRELADAFPRARLRCEVGA